MGPKVIYHLKVLRKGSKEYFIPEYDSLGSGLVVAIKLPSGDIDRLDLSELVPITDHVEELPYDMRKWKPALQKHWSYYTGMAGRKRLGTVSAVKVAQQQIIEFNSMTESPAHGAIWPASHLKVMKHFGRRPVGWGELFGDKPKFNKLLSRRIKQKISKQKKLIKSKSPSPRPTSISFVGGVPQRETSNTVFKPTVISGNPDNWPTKLRGRVSTGGCIASAMVNLGKSNRLGVNFIVWYEQAGQFIDGSPRVLLHKWLGIEKANLNQSASTIVAPTKRDGSDLRGFTVYYMPRAMITDERWAPKPIDWPLTYSGRLGIQEECDALSGELPTTKFHRNGSFMNWFYAHSRAGIRCRTHGSLVINCTHCAELVYKEWKKGKD